MATLFILDGQTYTTKEGVIAAMDQAKLTELGDVLTAGTELDRRNRAPNRLVIRFDVETATIYPGTTKRRSYAPLRTALLLSYTEQPAKTPTGGRYTARRLLVRTTDGRRWVGTMRKDSDIVKLRPEPKAVPAFKAE